MRHSFFAFGFFLLLSIVSYAQEKVSLEQVITLAVERNYDVKLSRNTAAAVATTDSYAWAAFLPTVNATGSYVINQNRQQFEYTNVSNNKKGPAKGNNSAAAVQLVWTLFDGTKMFATRERIAVLKEQGELIVKDQIVNTIAQIITNYFDVVRQKQQLMAIQEQMGVNEERVKLAEKKLQVGTGSKPELLQAKVDFNTQRTQALQQQAAIEQLKERLNALVGEQLPTLYDVSDSISINLTLAEDSISNNIVTKNYGLQSLRRNIDIANLSLRERRDEFFPVLNFNAAYNYNQTNNIQLINLLGPIYSLSRGFNYGLSINMPIFNGLATRRNIQLARINAERQQVLYEQQKTTVNIALKNAFINYRNTKNILAIEEETILLAKENVSIALERFRRGNTTYIELRTAQQSLADAYNRLISARYNSKLAETELLRLNGTLLK
jgi:outer membrane protein